MRLIFLYIYWGLVFSASTQDTTEIRVTPKFKTGDLVLNKTYITGSDSLSITNFKFYISNLEYFNNDSLVYTSRKKAHLIDMLNPLSLKIIESTSFNFNEIKFNVGIDSLTNVSGIFDGDLDPINGMYWTWQSGYINFKLEGISKSCPARKNKFYWHVGGYLQPFNAMRKISITCNSTTSLELIIQVDELFDKIAVSKIYQVMSPSEKSIQIADVLPSIFKTIQQ